jgi:hypothetical protein
MAPTHSSLEDIFKLRRELGDIRFDEVVRAASGHEIIPINMGEREDRELIRHLSTALNNFVRISERSGSRFTGRRINDVGSNLENQIVGEIGKTPLDIEKLGRSGYPDFKMKQQSGRYSYLEIKTSGNIHQDITNYRMFYFSSGDKITEDGRHLLLQILMQEETRGYWKVISWDLHDLSGLMVRLKTEFNAGFSDFEATTLLASSTPTE